MKRKKLTIQILLSIWLVSLIIINFDFLFVNEDNLLDLKKDNLDKRDNFTVLKVSANSKIIAINNNLNLNNTAMLGNGTRLNPYVIEGLTIDGNGSLYCVLINNTNKYFIVRKCTFHNSSYGIFLNNVSNGLLSDNIIYDNRVSGIKIENSARNNVSLNAIYDNDKYGIFLRNANVSLISANNMFQNNLTGIYLNYSCYNNITGNIISYHQYPIYLFSSNNSYVAFNSGTGNTYDIIEPNCKNNRFEGNNFVKEVEQRETTDNDSNYGSSKNIILDFTFMCLIIAFIFVLIFFLFNYLNRILKCR